MLSREGRPKHAKIWVCYSVCVGICGLGGGGGLQKVVWEQLTTSPSAPLKSPRFAEDHKRDDISFDSSAEGDSQ